MVDTQQGDTSYAATQQHVTYTITRHHRHWEVRDPVGSLVCLTVYKRGAEEVVRRLKNWPALEIETTTAPL